MPLARIRIDRLQFNELRIPFKVAFRHASAERAQTETVWIDAIGDDGAIGNGESCPREYVTGETISTARAFVERHDGDIRREITGLDALRGWAAAHRNEIDANPAAWCAVELALLDLLGKHQKVTIEALLSLPPLAGRFQYTGVLGDALPSVFQSMAERYRRMGFKDFKVKLCPDSSRDRNKLSALRSWPAGSIRVRADANNLWRTVDDAIAALGSLDFPFVAVEEPIGKNRWTELADLSSALKCPIILDESCARGEDLDRLVDPPSRWLINVRVSKMGGIIRALDVIEAARSRGIGVIVGAQVGETSLLTRAALTLARAAGETLVAQEGAFGTFLLERDMCDPPLMFGAGGLLDVSLFPQLQRPGLGITPGPRGAPKFPL
jgi:L-Ala-D/L-Glu epimerase / N-acetyl-D-glutamate racemase